MYYTSPLFRMEIWAALQSELNRLYQLFTARNPTFEANGGKVSVVSHSLGKISSTDLYLTLQSELRNVLTFISPSLQSFHLTTYISRRRTRLDVKWWSYFLC